MEQISLESIIESLRSKNFLNKNGRLTTFQRVKANGDKFEIFDSQDSLMQNILSKSDGIIMRNSFDKPIKKMNKLRF